MQDIQIKEYAYQVWRRRKLVLIFLATVMAITALFSARQTRVYRAATTIEIGAETPDAFFQDVVNVTPYGWWSALKYYETQYQVLQSRSLMSRVAERAIEKKLVKGVSVERLTSILKGGISIGSDDKSRLATIYFDDHDPQRAATFANLIAETYIDENLANKLRGVTQAVDWLTQRLDEIRKEKRVQEEELQKYKEEKRLVDVGDGGDVARANLHALAESLNRLKNKRIEIEAQYRKLKSLVKGTKRVDDLLGVVSSELLTKLKYDLAELRSQKGRFDQRYGKKHPKMVRLTAQIQAIEGSIRQEITNEVDRLKTRYLLAKAEEESIQKALEEQKLATLKAEEANRKLADIQMVTKMNQELFEALQKKLKEADLSALVRSNNIRVVDAALVPTSPIRPNVMANMVLALVIGLFGGIGLALGVESMDDTLKNHEDIDRYLQLPVLGVIPRLQSEDEEHPREIELLPFYEPTEPISEFYRTLRTNVMFLSANKGYKKVTVVSTSPSEGKTSCAVNLAVTMAQAGQKTILVELDLRRPRLHKKFKNSTREGFTDLLVGSSALDEIIRTSEVPNLDFITAGTIPPNPAELLASEAFKEAFRELEKRYDRIIVDSSPIAPVTDAVIIAQEVDGVLLVVRAGQTHRKAVRYALDQLKKVNSEVLGVVLNDVDVGRSGYADYQYYKYGYSHYGSDTEGDGDDVPKGPQLPTANA